eukprot:1158561-Pelagomonas_calceolata.AAC.5
MPYISANMDGFFLWRGPASVSKDVLQQRAAVAAAQLMLEFRFWVQVRLHTKRMMGVTSSWSMSLHQYINADQQRIEAEPLMATFSCAFKAHGMRAGCPHVLSALSSLWDKLPYHCGPAKSKSSLRCPVSTVQSALPESESTPEGAGGDAHLRIHLWILGTAPKAAHYSIHLLNAWKQSDQQKQLMHLNALIL